MKNCNLRLLHLSLWLLVFTFSTTGIIAQKRFTIQDCILYAFEHNPLVDVGIKDSSIAGLDVKRVKGSYLPRVGFASAFQYYFTKRQLLVEGGTPLAPPSLADGDPLAIKTGYSNSWYPAFNVNQLIFDPAYRNRYNIALQNQQLQV